MGPKDAVNPQTGMKRAGRSAASPRDGIAAHPLDRLGKGSLLESRLTSIAHLLTGSTANALIMFVSTTISARALGPATYGIFALVLTIGRLSERLLRFESWQPLIRYAAHEEIAGNSRRLSELFLYGLLLDIGSALLAALLAIAGGYALMPLLHLRPGDLPLIEIYALAIAVNVRGMPTAALRLSGQFRTLAYIQIFSSLLRLALAAIGLMLGAGVLVFVIVWTVVQMIDSLLFFWLGFLSLGKLAVPNPLRAELRGITTKFPGFMKFAWSTNISSALRTLTQEADTLLVGALAGNASAGFYHIAKRMAKVAEQVGAMVQTVIYPDLARLWAHCEFRTFRQVTARVQLALAPVGLGILGVVWLVGDWFINAAFGKEFASAYPLLIAQLVAVVLIFHAAPSRSALLAMNRPTFILLIALLSTAVFFAVAWLTMPVYGALGANLAHIAFAALTALAADIVWWRGSRRQAEAPGGAL